MIRAVNGARSKLLLLSIGLDRYTPGEEGIATQRAQITQTEFEEYSYLYRLFAVGLAQGIDGKPRDFREVFEIMNKYFYFTELKSGKSGGSKFTAMDKAVDEAWKWSVRVFRGTDCHTKGVCFPKDKAYPQGNIAIWELVKKQPRGNETLQHRQLRPH